MLDTECTSARPIPLARICSLTVICAVLSLATGCADMFQSKQIADGRLTKSLAAEYAKKSLDGIYQAATTKEKRNQELDKLMTLSDQSYQDFKTKLYSNDAGLEFGFDLVGIGLSTAGALASAGAAPILSGTAAAVQGAQGKLNSRFYLDKTIETLINAMDTIRANKKQIILLNMTKDLADYSIEAGVRDVFEYHNGGSLISALVKVAVESGEAKTQATNKLQDTEERLARSTVFTKTKSSVVLKKFLIPDEKTNAVDTNNMKKLRSWMEKNGLEDYSVPMFVFTDDPKLQDKQEKAVEDLGLATD